MRDRTLRLRKRATLAATMLVATAVPATAAATPTPWKPASVEFTAKRPGEALLDMRALAPGTDWQRAGQESAVVRLELDGGYNQDVVLFEGERPFDYGSRSARCAAAATRSRRDSTSESQLQERGACRSTP